MVALARDLLLFRAAPQDLPYSPLLLAALVALGLVCDALILHLGGEPAAALWGLLAITALRLLILALLFAWRGITARLVKTLSALWLVDLAFRALLLPPALVLAGELGAEAPSVPSPPAQLALLAVFALAVWHLLVQGHVLRHALEVSLALGTLVAALVGLSSFLLFFAASSFLGRSA